MEASGNNIVNLIYEAGAIGYPKEIVNPIAVEEEEARCNFVTAKYKDHVFLDDSALKAYVKEFDSIKMFSKKKTKNSGVADSSNSKVKKSSSDPSLLLKMAVASDNKGQMDNRKASLLGGDQVGMKKNHSFSPGLVGMCDPAAAPARANFSYAQKEKESAPPQPEASTSDRLSGFLNSLVPKRSEAQPVELGYDEITYTTTSTSNTIEELDYGPIEGQEDVTKELARRSVKTYRRGSLGGRGSAHGSAASLSSVGGLDARGSSHEKMRVKTSARRNVGEVDSGDPGTENRKMRRGRKSDNDLSLLESRGPVHRTRSGKSVSSDKDITDIDEGVKRHRVRRSRSSDGSLAVLERASNRRSGRKARDGSVGSGSALSVGSDEDNGEDVRCSPHGNNRKARKNSSRDITNDLEKGSSHGKRNEAAGQRTRPSAHQNSIRTPGGEDDLGYEQSPRSDIAPVRHTVRRGSLGYGQSSRSNDAPASRTVRRGSLGYGQSSFSETATAPRPVRRGSVSRGSKSNEGLVDMGLHARRARRRASLGGVVPAPPAEEVNRMAGSPKRRQRRGSVGLSSRPVPVV